MLQDILETKSHTDTMSTAIAVGLAESVICGKHRSILFLAERHLNRDTSAETLVEVHAVVIEDAFEQATFVGVASANSEILSPTVFETQDKLVFGEGVGDEVTCNGEA